MALFDTTLVMVSRVVNKQNPFSGGQDHTSHRLVHLGLSGRGAVLVTYVVAAALGGAAIAMVQLGPAPRVAAVTGLLAAAVLAAVPLWRAPVYTVPWSEAKGRKVATTAAVPSSTGAVAAGTATVGRT